MPEPTHEHPDASASSSHSRRRRLSNSFEDPDYAAFVAEALREQERERIAELPDCFFSELEDHVLATAVPVEMLAGGNSHRAADQDGAPHAQVMNLRRARLRRYLRQLPPLQKRILLLYWGIGCDRPRSQAQVAAELNLPQPLVAYILGEAMTEMCRCLRVPSESAAEAAPQPVSTCRTGRGGCTRTRPASQNWLLNCDDE